MNEVHLFWSWLWADWLQWSKTEIVNKLWKLDLVSEFTFKLVIDLEEVLWATNRIEYTENKNQARKQATDLFDILTDTSPFTNYQWLIIRVNPIWSKEYIHDKTLFAELGKRYDIWKLSGVYIPDFEDPEMVLKVSKDLRIDPWKVMPIIESSVWHDCYDDILAEMIAHSDWNPLYTIWAGDAYHRFHNRAEEHSGKPKYISLTPDTSIWYSHSSRLAHQETVRQLQKTNKVNELWQVNVMLATSTYIWKWCGDITQHKIDRYSKKWVCYLNPGQEWCMWDNIWSVCIHPDQLKVSWAYKETSKLDQNIPLDHGHRSNEIVAAYLHEKAHKRKPTLNNYILLDVQFYIALYIQMEKHGLEKCLKKFPLLRSYMWADSILLDDDLFKKYHKRIAKKS